MEEEEEEEADWIVYLNSSKYFKFLIRKPLLIASLGCLRVLGT